MMPTPVYVVAWYGMLMCCGGPGASARVLPSPMTFGLSRGPPGSVDARPFAGLLRLCAKCQDLDWSDMPAPGLYPRAPEAALGVPASSLLTDMTTTAMAVRAEDASACVGDCGIFGKKRYFQFDFNMFKMLCAASRAIWTYFSSCFEAILHRYPPSAMYG